MIQTCVNSSRPARRSRGSAGWSVSTHRALGTRSPPWRGVPLRREKQLRAIAIGRAMSPGAGGCHRWWWSGGRARRGAAAGRRRLRARVIVIVRRRGRRRRRGGWRRRRGPGGQAEAEQRPGADARGGGRERDADRRGARGRLPHRGRPGGGRATRRSERRERGFACAEIEIFVARSAKSAAAEQAGGSRGLISLNFLMQQLVYDCPVVAGFPATHARLMQNLFPLPSGRL